MRIHYFQGLLASILLLTAGSSGVVNSAFAATPSLGVDVSTDVSLKVSSVFVGSGDVLIERRNMPLSATMLPNVPSNANLNALARSESGDLLVVFDTTIELPAGDGSITVNPRQVVRLRDGIYSMEFDSQANGVRVGTRIDALSVHPDGLVLSFDTAVTLGGATVIAADAVLWDGTTYTKLFDAKAAGVHPGLNTDAMQFISTRGHIQLSFDSPGLFNAAYIDDAEIVEYQSTTNSFIPVTDVNASLGALFGADVDAIVVYTDSDDDGLNDRIESNTGIFVSEANTGTNPLTKDSDGDGFGDGVEVANGTDPNNAADPGSRDVPTLPIIGLLCLCIAVVVSATSFRNGKR